MDSWSSVKEPVEFSLQWDNEGQSQSRWAVIKDGRLLWLGQLNSPQELLSRRSLGGATRLQDYTIFRVYELLNCPHAQNLEWCSVRAISVRSKTHSRIWHSLSPLRGEVMCQPLSVWLLVCEQNSWKNLKWILMKFSGKTQKMSQTDVEYKSAPTVFQLLLI